MDNRISSVAVKRDNAVIGYGSTLVRKLLRLRQCVQLTKLLNKIWKFVTLDTTQLNYKEVKRSKRCAEDGKIRHILN